MKQGKPNKVSTLTSSLCHSERRRDCLSLSAYLSVFLVCSVEYLSSSYDSATEINPEQVNNVETLKYLWFEAKLN